MGLQILPLGQKITATVLSFKETGFSSYAGGAGGQQTCFCKGPDSKDFRLCGPEEFCCNYPTQLM